MGPTNQQIIEINRAVRVGGKVSPKVRSALRLYSILKMGVTIPYTDIPAETIGLLEEIDSMVRNADNKGIAKLFEALRYGN